MDECDSRYTKSAEIATSKMRVNICVIKRSNVHSRLSPWWFHINSWTCAQDVRLHIVGIQEPKSAQVATRTMRVNICVIKRSNVHSRLSPWWVHSNSWTCAQDVRWLHVVGIQEPKSAQVATRTASILCSLFLLDSINARIYSLVFVH